MARKTTAGKKAAATKASATKASAKKAASKKAASKKAAAKKATTKKAATKKATAKKAATKKAATAKATTKAAAKKPAAKKAAAKKSPFNKAFFDEMRKALQAERADYFHTAQSAKAEADELARMREPGDVQFDDESGEGDTLAVERDFDLALSAQARQTVEEIDRALAKIDDGTYGLCEVSGDPIPKERLRAIPWARERVEYKVGSFGNR